MVIPSIALSSVVPPTIVPHEISLQNRHSSACEFAKVMIPVWIIPQLYPPQNLANWYYQMTTAAHILSIVHMGTKPCNEIIEPIAICDSFVEPGLTSLRWFVHSLLLFSPKVKFIENQLEYVLKE